MSTVEPTDEEGAMHARMTTIQGQPDSVDDAIEQVKSGVLPVLDQQDGFKGFTVIVDRSSGKMIGTSYWESREAMEASEEAVQESRADAARSGGASSEPSVEHFEVVVDTTA
jgi:heme-degrading monooxygenase HmoA